MVDVADARYEIDKDGAKSFIYIRKGIPELEAGAPFWLYNGLRDLLHEGRKCRDESELAKLVATIKGRGLKVKKVTMPKKKPRKVKWVGSENVMVEAELDDKYDELIRRR